MNGRVIATIAGCAALAAAPSSALARNGFPDYRQAAADQYPQQPPPGTSGSSGPASNGHNGHSSPGRPASTGRNGVLGAGSHRGVAPVAVPSRPVPAAKGSLPFTGSDLSGLVVLALILIAAGLFAGALARATRRRRRAIA